MQSSEQGRAGQMFWGVREEWLKESRSVEGPLRSDALNTE